MRFATKRLLKDLPFMTKGTVLVKCNNTFVEHCGETLYSGSLFSSSSNGIKECDNTEKELIKLIWDNTEWFEDAEFSEPLWDVKDNSIIIRFEKPVDKEELLGIAKGIYKTLTDNFQSTTMKMGWSEFVELFNE